MKKKQFKIQLMGRQGGDGSFFDVSSTDYSESYSLIRYKDTLYEYEFGLWAIRLEDIKEGKGNWKKYGSGIALPQTTISTMMEVVCSCEFFIKELFRVKDNASKTGIEKKNPIQKNLFDI